MGRVFATLSHNSCLLHFQLFQSNVYSTSDKSTHCMVYNNMTMAIYIIMVNF